MNIEQAKIILSIDPLHWQILCEVIKEEQSIMRKSMEDPGSPRDLDQYNKGGIVFAEQVMGYIEMAQQIINPPKTKENL